MPLPVTPHTIKDNTEVQLLMDHYQPYLKWEGKGILHDLSVLHKRNNPSRLLLLSIALGISHAKNLALGRQEKRRRNLLIGWLNENYEHVHSVINELVLGDTSGDLSGPEAPLRAYQAAHPDNEEIEALVGDSKFQH
jgi:hypothetical protein